MSTVGVGLKTLPRAITSSRAHSRAGSNITRAQDSVLAMELSNSANPIVASSSTATSTPTKPDIENSIPKRATDELSVISSTNQLLAVQKDATVLSCALSIAVSALQLLLFCAIAAKSTQFDKPGLSIELVAVRIFIAIYLPAYLVHSVSDAFWSVFDAEDEFRSCSGVSALVVVLLISPFAFMLSIIVSAKDGNWAETRSSMAALLEFGTLMSSLVATLLITKQQTDIITSVFNFAGLLLILELDDMLARLLKWKVVPFNPTSWSKKNAEELAKAKEHNDSVKQFTVFCVLFIPSVVYLLE
jgi:hypothetical protein